MTLYLGIDGGGTGCRAAVADAAGHVLGRGDAGPANITSDITSARANILAATEQALAAAVGAGDVAQALPRLRAGLGLAGANAAGPEALALPFAAKVVTDAQTAVIGALGTRDGIVAAIGTGSVFASQRGKAFRHIGGWGLVLGDEASGAWMGRAALAATLRAVDGLEPGLTPLAQSLLGELGGAQGIVAFARDATAAEFARLAPRLVVAEDPLADAILQRAEAEITAAIAHLQDGHQHLPVVFLGGIGAFWAGRLAAAYDILPPEGTALDGALRLARGLA